MTGLRRALVVAILLGAVAMVPSAAQAAPKDQVVITGSVDVPAGRTVGNVVVIDGPVNVAGTVKGHVVAVHGVVRISGFVDGTVTAVSKRAVLGPTARIHGDLLYGGSRPSIAPSATVTGKISNEGWTDITRPGFGVVAYLVLWLAGSLSLLAFGVLVWWLLPGVMDAARASFQQQTGAAIGWGLGLFFGLPALAVIALITLVGIPFGIGLLLALVPLGAVGYVTTGSIIGRLIVGPKQGWLIAGLAGLGVLRVLALVPYLGIVIWFATTVIGLGALLVALWRARAGVGAAAGPSAPSASPAGSAPGSTS